MTRFDSIHFEDIEIDGYSINGEAYGNIIYDIDGDTHDFVTGEVTEGDGVIIEDVVVNYIIYSAIDEEGNAVDELPKETYDKLKSQLQEDTESWYACF